MHVGIGQPCSGQWSGAPCGGRPSGDCEVERWQERARVRIRSYVGGGMHGWAAAASPCCIRASARRGDVDGKSSVWSDGGPACEVIDDADSSNNIQFVHPAVNPSIHTCFFFFCLFPPPLHRRSQNAGSGLSYFSAGF